MTTDAALEAWGILSMLVLTSLLDVIALNLFLQAREPRSHNQLRVINECLARQQLAYPIWYITLTVLANFSKLTAHETVLVRWWMQIATVLSVLFWLGGLSGVAGQDQAIREDHECSSTGKCQHSSWRLRLFVLGLNLFLAAVSLSVAAIFLARSEVLKALTQ